MRKWVTGAVLLLTIGLCSPAAQAGCLGDCTADGQITVPDLAEGVGIALGTTLPSGCETFDFDNDGSVTVDDVVAVIDDAPNTCPYVGHFAGVVPLSGGQVGELAVTVEADGSASGTLTITDGSGSSASGSSAAVIDIVNVAGTADLRTGAFSLGGVFEGKPVSITGTFPSQAGTNSSVIVEIDGVDYTGSINAVFTPVPTPTATQTPSPTETPTEGPPPTGQRLVLAVQPDLVHPLPDIIVVNLDGSGRRNLTDTPNLADFNPVWSPDGSKIAWAAETVIPDVGQYYHIVVMHADGTGRTDLMPEARGAAEQPSWSPDGTKIVFQDIDRIVVIDANGSNEKTILTYRNRIGAPDWSPDGSKIAFAGTLHIPEDQNDREADLEIYVMNADGSGMPTRLTNNSYRDSFPAWSPDGKKIAFEADSPNSLTTLWVMNANGTGQTKLITDFFGGTAPAWSRDGTQIAYYRLGVVVANADGSLPSVVVPITEVGAPCLLTGPTCTFFDLR